MVYPLASSSQSFLTECCFRKTKISRLDENAQSECIFNILSLTIHHNKLNFHRLGSIQSYLLVHIKCGCLYRHFPKVYLFNLCASGLFRSQVNPCLITWVFRIRFVHVVHARHQDFSQGVSGVKQTRMYKSPDGDQGGKPLEALDFSDFGIQDILAW